MKLKAMRMTKSVLLLLSIPTWSFLPVAGLALAQPFEAYLDRGPKVVVWRDQAAHDVGMRRFIPRDRSRAFRAAWSTRAATKRARGVAPPRLAMLRAATGPRYWRVS